MRDAVFEREVQESMKTLNNVVRVNGNDGASAIVRMIHNFVVIESFTAPEKHQETLKNLGNACLSALGGEKMLTIQKPEIPAYRKDIPWDSFGLKCNLEACRRVALRHGALKGPCLKEWLDYTLKVIL